MIELSGVIKTFDFSRNINGQTTSHVEVVSDERSTIYRSKRYREVVGYEPPWHDTAEYRIAEYVNIKQPKETFFVLPDPAYHPHYLTGPNDRLFYLPFWDKRGINIVHFIVVNKANLPEYKEITGPTRRIIGQEYEALEKKLSEAREAAIRTGTNIQNRLMEMLS